MKLLPTFLATGLLALNVLAADSPKSAKGKLTAIQGIAEATEKKLNTAGVASVDELLEKGATTKGREEIAAKSGLSPAQILRFVNYADLFRIKGIAGQTAELLEASGVNTVAELAQRNPANLAAKVKEVNEARKLSGNTPGERQLGEWIESAKALPKMVTY